MGWFQWLNDERIRYLIVGVWNTLFGYVLFLVVLALLGDPLHGLESSSISLVALVGRNYYLVVSWIVWVLGVPPATWAMKHFAFRSAGPMLPQIGRAYSVYLPAQWLGTLVLWLTVRVLHFSPPVGALVTIGVTTVISYLGHKYFTFRKPLEVGEVYDPALLEPKPRKTDL